MSVISKIRRQGGAAVITIPPALLQMLDLNIGSQVTLSVDHGKLIAQPTTSRRKRYTLADLLEGSDEMKRLTAETAWAQEGHPVGREIT
ncbi:MAG: PbsX family transcriptional regulator [Alphaproteobacteria bacterium]|nr:PbsX family transcriptional regulator [Alphaproteobacteria bacterium]